MAELPEDVGLNTIEKINTRFEEVLGFSPSARLVHAFSSDPCFVRSNGNQEIQLPPNVYFQVTKGNLSRYYSLMITHEKGHEFHDSLQPEIYEQFNKPLTKSEYPRALTNLLIAEIVALLTSQLIVPNLFEIETNYNIYSEEDYQTVRALAYGDKIDIEAHLADGLFGVSLNNKFVHFRAIDIATAYLPARYLTFKDNIKSDSNLREIINAITAVSWTHLEDPAATLCDVLLPYSTYPALTMDLLKIHKYLVQEALKLWPIPEEN